MVDEVDKILRPGSRGREVWEAQEWLCLNRNAPAVKVDGDFGPATELAVRRFQDAVGLSCTGRIDQVTRVRLTEDMATACPDLSDVEDVPLRDLVVLAAGLHLKAGARELGGKNLGPWVRLYNGKDGPDQPWCAGAASFWMKQAAHWKFVEPPIRGSVSCDELAAQAKSAGFFNSDAKDVVKPGDLFLIRGKRDDDWIHTGVVEGVMGPVYATIEGNTNSDGSRDGYEVCRRVRPFGNADFVRMGP